jgi:hypothetical protein
MPNELRKRYRRTITLVVPALCAWLLCVLPGAAEEGSASCAPPIPSNCPAPPTVSPLAPPSTVTPSTPSTPTTSTPPATSDTSAAAMAAAGFGSESASAVGGGMFSGAGYIDPAIPMTQFRLRVDDALGSNRPDRADFFYPECGVSGPKSTTGFAAKNVNYQDVMAYLEVAPTDRFSGFIELPYRFVQIAFPNPAVTDDHSGFSDLNFGFKFAFINTKDLTLTYQTRVYAPTGDGGNGLGTLHWTVEPALLARYLVTDRVVLEGEVKDWSAIHGKDSNSGNVLDEGLGVSYLLFNGDNYTIAPVVEVIEWTVLNGGEVSLNAGPKGAPIGAGGNVIVNGKVGLRLGFGEELAPGGLRRMDLYIGYGRALTGDVWYKDIYRLELRYRF